MYSKKFAERKIVSPSSYHRERKSIWYQRNKIARRIINKMRYLFAMHLRGSPPLYVFIWLQRELIVYRRSFLCTGKRVAEIIYCGLISSNRDSIPSLHNAARLLLD